MKPFRLLDCVVTRDERELTLYRRGDAFYIQIDGYDLMSSRAHGSEDELARLALAEVRTGDGRPPGGPGTRAPPSTPSSSTWTTAPRPSPSRPTSTSTPSALLDATDLVFIDPVETGWSRPAPGVESREFTGITRDVESVGDFIRLWVSRNGRWASPKLIAGESYGTTRAAGLAPRRSAEPAAAGR